MSAKLAEKIRAAEIDQDCLRRDLKENLERVEKVQQALKRWETKTDGPSEFRLVIFVFHTLENMGFAAGWRPYHTEEGLEVADLSTVQVERLATKQDLELLRREVLIEKLKAVENRLSHLYKKEIDGLAKNLEKLSLSY